MPTLISRARPVAAVSSAAGAALATAVRLTAAVRPAAKPLHPRGDVVVGHLTRRGLTPPAGVDWLDGSGSDEVLVRRSRAIGLPDRLPDIHGLALRVPTVDGGYSDILLASTGTGRVGRYLLTAGRTPGARPLTTLLPYRTVVGPVVVGAVARGEGSYEIAFAVGSGPWRPFADLTLTSTSGPDPDLAFDPVRRTPPGLTHYGWVRRLREPSYRTARRTRTE